MRSWMWAFMKKLWPHCGSVSEQALPVVNVWGKRFKLPQLTHESFLAIDDSCKIFFWYLPNWTFTESTEFWPIFNSSYYWSDAIHLFVFIPLKKSIIKTNCLNTSLPTCKFSLDTLWHFYPDPGTFLLLIFTTIPSMNSGY